MLQLLDALAAQSVFLLLECRAIRALASLHDDDVRAVVFADGGADRAHRQSESRPYRPGVLAQSRDELDARERRAFDYALIRRLGRRLEADAGRRLREALRHGHQLVDRLLARDGSANFLLRALERR